MPRATCKDHAEINLDIWGDDDWLDLSPQAQHLYFVLWTSPQLSYCGTGEWHSARIATKARGWTPAAVEAAAVELSRELFLIIDTATEEFILRSWVKHDGIWKKPNMAVSMANARGALASRILRGVIVHEVAKIKARNIAEATAESPVSTSWQRDAVKNLLSQKAIDPTTLAPFTPVLIPLPTLDSNHHLTPVPTPALTVNGGVGVNPHADPGPTPAPAPFSSSILQRGSVSGERHQEPDLGPEPPSTCSRHRNGTSAPCGGCADARRIWATWDTERRRRGERQRHAFLAELDACPDCDEHGWLDEGDTLIRCPKHNWERAHA